MKCKLVCLFILLCFFGFSQDRVNRTYKFSIQSITSYQQAKPHYDLIRGIFSESKSINYTLIFSSSDQSFKVTSTLFFDKQKLSDELKKNGLVLTNFISDGETEN